MLCSRPNASPVSMLSPGRIQGPHRAEVGARGRIRLPRALDDHPRLRNRRPGGLAVFTRNFGRGVYLVPWTSPGARPGGQGPAPTATRSPTVVGGADVHGGVRHGERPAPLQPRRPPRGRPPPPHPGTGTGVEGYACSPSAMRRGRVAPASSSTDRERPVGDPRVGDSGRLIQLIGAGGAGATPPACAKISSGTPTAV